MVAFKRPTETSGLTGEKQDEAQLRDEISQHFPNSHQRESNFL